MKNQLVSHPYIKRATSSLIFYKRRLYVFAAFSTLYWGTLYKSRNHKNKLWRLAVAGSLSNMLWEIAFHFADTVNIKSKLHTEQISTVNMYKHITKQEGLYGLSKGISATFYGSIVAGFMYFSLYKLFKQWMYQLTNNKLHPSLVFLTSSFIAETLTLSLYYPYNLFKSRLQTSNSIYKYKSLLHAFQKEFQENGAMSLYKGWWPFLIMFSTTIALQFTVYETYLKYVREHYSRSYKKNEFLHIVWGSFIAGAIGHALTNGLEVIVVAKQWIPDADIRSIVKKEGYGLLTKGLGARVYYQSTQSIVFFSTVTYIGKLFNVKIEE